MMTLNPETSMNRRQMIGAGAGLALVSALPLSAAADTDDLAAARRDLFGDRPLNEGRVSLKLPPIAENGFSVPVTVEVDSPMTAEDHVRRIAILSPRNPVATLIVFNLTPASGLARAESRVRLAGTQTVQAIAEMSDGTLWSAGREVVVTLAACVVL